MIYHQFVLKMLFGLGFFEIFTTDLRFLYFLQQILDIRDPIIDPPPTHPPTNPPHPLPVVPNLSLVCFIAMQQFYSFVLLCGFGSFLRNITSFGLPYIAKTYFHFFFF